MFLKKLQHFELKVQPIKARSQKESNAFSHSVSPAGAYPCMNVVCNCIVGWVFDVMQGRIGSYRLVGVGFILRSCNYLA